MSIDDEAPVAVVTGASRGFGLALTRALAQAGWSVIVDARAATSLHDAVAGLAGAHTVAGDVTAASHRAALTDAVREFGRLDLLVNNASRLGPSPQPVLANYPIEQLRAVYDVNVFAPLALVQELLPLLVASAGTVVNVSSDAAVEPYPGWGGYGSSKAALDQISAILAAEQPGVRVYAFDPGDMRTTLHQQAFPGEDISDRPEPESVVPALQQLLAARPPSGRYRALDFAPAAALA